MSAASAASSAHDAVDEVRRASSPGLTQQLAHAGFAVALPVLGFLRLAVLLGVSSFVPIDVLFILTTLLVLLINAAVGRSAAVLFQPGSNPLNRVLIAQCPSLRHPAYTAVMPWTFFPDLHALIAAFVRFRLTGPADLSDWPEPVTSPDARLSMMTMLDPKLSQTSPIVLVFPGALFGHHALPYIDSLVRRLVDVGLRAVVVQGEGTYDCEGIETVRISPCLADVPYVEAAIAFARSGFRPSRLLAIAFATDALRVTHYLGHAGNDSPFVGAMMVSSPHHIGAVDAAMTASACRRIIYHRYWMRLLHWPIANYARLFQARGVDVSAAVATQSIRAFDTAVTCRVYPEQTGGDVDEYHRRASTLAALPRLATPTLFLNAFDDPLASPDVLASVVRGAASAGNASFLVTSHGSHCAWLRWPLLPAKASSWLDDVAVEWLGSANAVAAKAQR